MRRLTLTAAVRGILIVGGGLAMAGCAAVPVVVPPPAPVIAPAPPPETPKSAAARAYFAQVQANLLSRGQLRTDVEAPDAPFTDRTLAEAFLRVALYDEFQPGVTGPVALETASRLRRWQAPVRVALRFGASVPEDRRAIERARVASYLARMSRVTGHPIRLSDAAPNFQIHIVSEDERAALGPAVALAMPGLSDNEVGDILNLPATTYCQVSVTADPKTSVYLRAFAVLRAENPDILHQSCLNEEIAQALGLPNDSPRARPSIFNDDQEFALLTPMDELMLRILYDPRLRPGMTEAEARPIVELIATELMGGGV